MKLLTIYCSPRHSVSNSMFMDQGQGILKWPCGRKSSWKFIILKINAVSQGFFSMVDPPCPLFKKMLYFICTVNWILICKGRLMYLFRCYLNIWSINLQWNMVIMKHQVPAILICYKPNLFLFNQFILL